MGKVRTRKETGKLYLDFTYQGLRCREQTALPDTPANRKRVEALLQAMEAKILLGIFDYAEQFPASRNLEKLLTAKAAASDREAQRDSTKNQTPLFTDFAEQWFSECKIQWRKSHVRNVE